MNASTNRIEEASPDLHQVIALGQAIEDQLRLFYAMLDEVTADADVRNAALHLACEASHLWTASQKLAQATGIHSAADLESRLESAIRLVEPLVVGLQTLTGTLPEVLEDLAHAGTLQKLGSETAEWIHIVRKTTCLLQGSSPSLSARATHLLEDAARWSGELVVAWETLAATLPEMLQDESLHHYLSEMKGAIGVWASVATEARAIVARCGGGDMAKGVRAIVCSVRDGLDDVQKEGKKDGGVFTLVRLVLSGKTVYVLRNVISIAYRVLKTMNESGKKKSAC